MAKRLLLFALLMACINEPIFAQQAPPGLLATARDLVLAISKKDVQRLPRFMESPKDFSTNGNLDRFTTEYIYDGKEARSTFGKKAKSISELLNLGRTKIVIRMISGKDAVVYFIPESFAAEAKGSEFYKREFRKKYFACHFSKIGIDWKMRRNFCYAETDVEPYPYPN